MYFKDLDEPVSTHDLKFLLNQELEVVGEGPNDGVSALGRFRVDPSYTDFVGKNDHQSYSDKNNLLYKIFVF